MNETIQTILTRRSIRAFQDRPIPAGDMKLIVQAALHAPSGMGYQTWQFTVVSNPEKSRSWQRPLPPSSDGTDTICIALQR